MDGKHELYRLSDDPGETRNLYRAGEAQSAAMLDRLEDVAATVACADADLDAMVAPTAGISAEDEDALRSLGYIR